MIITKIRLQEEHPMVGFPGNFPLPICDLSIVSDAGDNGYIIKDSKGLGPPNLTSVVVGFDDDGIPVIDGVPDDRELTFKIGFNPSVGQSYSDLRDALYRMINRSVLISLMNESMVIAQTTGYIRQFDASHFTDKPDVTIIIECNDGEFVSPNTVSIPLSTLYVEGPFINYDEGTAPTGLDLQFKYTAVADGTGFQITNHARFGHSPLSYIHNTFAVAYAFHTDDIITMSTHPRQKRLILERGINTYDLAGFINAGAVWPKLYSGVNWFEWSFDTVWMDWLSASYVPRYWGV